MLTREYSPLGGTRGDTLYGCGREVEVVVRVDIPMCRVCGWGVFATWGGVPRCAGCVIYDQVFAASLGHPRECFNGCYNEGGGIVINAGRERGYPGVLGMLSPFATRGGARGDASGRDKEVKVFVRWDAQRLPQNK